MVFPFEVTSQDSSAQKPIVELNETRNINTRCRGKETSSNSVRKLKTRPIFHFKSHTIQLHILICFMAIAVSKHIEIKTEVSIREFITQAKKITDARLMNQINKKEITMRVPVTKVIRKIIAKLNL